MAANKKWMLFKFVLPDIVINSNANQGTDKVYETTFHELAHASHFNTVGSRYWIKYINYIITYGVYGDGHGKNSEMVALGEAWGYHMGYYLIIKEFGANNRVLTTSAFENFDPRLKPNRVGKSRYSDSYGNRHNIGWTGWIPGGLILDIIDSNKDEIREGCFDKVSGYGLKDVFEALDSDIDSPQKFRNRLLKENNNMDSKDLVDLFTAYYWN
ncbi:hypothetical protein F8C76_11200 [Flagellimonas olearia]|uniref:Uncharacterized protein n=1 Tax=Flagellimonas olearia TaxID=552546 RepID=A0A6I1DYL3_9FLAO|nr:hypothetical protein F8C76_11200 [Allomuricauda olearia]